jgi:hypothetical protein
MHGVFGDRIAPDRSVESLAIGGRADRPFVSALFTQLTFTAHARPAAKSRVDSHE